MTTSAERFKTRHASLARVLHGEIRRHPGGYQELANQLGRNAQSLINQFNPATIDQAPPADLLLDVIEVINARATVGVVAGMIGLRVMPDDSTMVAPESDAAAFVRVTAECGDVLHVGATALADGRLDADERKQMRLELTDLIAAAEQMLKRIDR